MPLTPQTLTPATTPTSPPLSVDVTTSMSSVWRRSLLLPEGLDGASAQPSPRARPAIRTNPWLPVRWSSSSAASSTWMNHPEAATRRLLDDFFADESSASSPPPPPAPSCGGGNDRHFDVVMDGDELRVIAQHPHHATDYRFRQQQQQQTVGSSAVVSCGGSGASNWVDTDDRYAQLIRETEEMLLQLENDELLLGTTRKLDEINGPVAVKTKATIIHSSNKTTTTSSTPINRNVTRRRKKRLSTASRRSACRATSQSDLFSSSSSSESSDDVSTPGRTGRYWSSRRRPRSANKSRPLQKTREKESDRIASHSTLCFAPQQNGRVQATSLPSPPVLPDRTINGNNQRTDCTPDEWPEHDRPPSPAPMDPHCHRQATPVVSRRNYGFVSSSSQQQQLQQRPSSSSSSSRTSYSGIDRLHQLMEQERLESQIALLCQQLKDATDDYYFYEAGRGRLTPTSSDFSL